MKEKREKILEVVRNEAESLDPLLNTFARHGRFIRPSHWREKESFISAFSSYRKRGRDEDEILRLGGSEVFDSGFLPE